MQNDRDIKIIILAAGKGKRMQSDLPKVLVELGKRPMIEYVVETVEALNIVPVVVIGNKGDEVKEYLKNRVDYVLQKEQLGTGDAVSKVKNELKNFIGNILVLYGDHPLVKKETLEKIFTLQENTGAIITLATTRVDDFRDEFELFAYYGRILRVPIVDVVRHRTTDREGRIVAIREAKDCSEEEIKIKEVNPGYYCFDSAWLWQNIDKLKCNNIQGEYYLTDLVELAVKQKKNIQSVEIDPIQCLGANTPEQLRELEKFI